MREIDITLYKSELIYDVQNKTWLAGESRRDGDNDEAVSKMQADDEEANANQVMRSVTNAYATLKVKLGEWLTDSQTWSGDTMLDNGSESNTIDIILTVPYNFNNAMTVSLAQAMHQYIVNLAIGEWYMLTNKEEAADYMTLAAANLEQIKEAINKRVRPEAPSRPTIHSGVCD